MHVTDGALTEAQYLRFVLEHSDGTWELHCGRLVEKPPMTMEHGWVMHELRDRLRAQLPRADYYVQVNHGRLRRAADRYYVPDVLVVPMEQVRRLWGHRAVERYTEPLPLVVEVWSPSTGAYDIDSKLPEYQRRGDLEIWRIHPYERTLTAWVRQPDGSYRETLYTGGSVQAAFLPNVSIELASLFD